MEFEDGLEDSDEEQNEDFIENPDLADVVDEDPIGNGDNDEDQNVAEGEEGNNETTGRKPVKKRVVLNPRPKLDAQRLSSSKGIPILPQIFENKKFKGKGHEKEDLDYVMAKLEHWGHRLFPLMTFDTLLGAIEKLGTKKPVQVIIKKMRLDMPILDNDFVTQLDDDDDPPIQNSEMEQDSPHEVDAFEELLRSREVANNVPVVAQETTKTITDEMRERMERNKRLALERRRSRQLQQKETKDSNLLNDSDSTNKDSQESGSNDLITVQNSVDGTTNISPDSEHQLTLTDVPENNNFNLPNRNDSETVPNSSENSADLLPDTENQLETVNLSENILVSPKSKNYRTVHNLSEDTTNVTADSKIQLGMSNMPDDDIRGFPNKENAKGTDLLNEDELLNEMWGENL